MGYSRFSWEKEVRRRGGKDTVRVWGEDDGGIDGIINIGDRRSRQIAKRHWLKHTYEAWCPEDSYISVKKPGRKEVKQRLYPDYVPLA